MSTGVFSLMCPRCGADLHTGVQGVEECCGCGSEYVERFGYLFPHTVMTTDPTPAATGAAITSTN
jgi:hypothetical protein